MLPTLLLKNQFGEVSDNYVEGGSGALWCNFIVDPANGNGLGIRTLKSNGIANVFMHTTATPALGNPNPAAGYIYVQLAANYTGYNFGNYGFVSPPTGSAISTGLTVGVVYTIASVGASTSAQWATAGLEAGLVPAVNQSFVAAATSIAGGGTVYAVGSSGLDSVEIVGDPNQMVGATGGSLILLQCLNDGTLATPATNTVVGLQFSFNAAAVY